MAYVVGDNITVRYEVRDPTTGALTDAATTVAVTQPDGTPLVPAPTPTHPAAGTYDAAWPLATAGVWRWTWTATGAVADTTDGAVYVYAVGTVVPWVPTRRQVAKYIAERTVPADQSSDAPLNDFTDLTTPTAVQADEHIAAAVAWVATAAGTVTSGLYGSAAEVAAVRAAGMIELAYPVRDADVNTAVQLLAQADTWLAALVEGNEDVVDPGDGGGDTVGHVLPRWAFPEPVSYGDVIIW